LNSRSLVIIKQTSTLLPRKTDLQNCVQIVLYVKREKTMIETRDSLFKTVFLKLETDFDANGEKVLQQLRTNPIEYMKMMSIFLFEGYKATKSKDIEKSIEGIFDQLEKTILNVSSQLK
jgi:hypothetical protein